MSMRGVNLGSGRPSAGSRIGAAVSKILLTERPWVGYLCALIVGAAIVYSAFPLERVFPRHSLDFPIAGDAGQHVVGQRYFIADAWRWPILRAKNLGTPKGIDISMTDSIPLLAILAKLARGALPAGFHTIDLWLAIAFLLQPVAAVFALRSAGEKRLAPALFVALVAISVPSFLYRIGHAALTGHFLILLAIGFYFRILRNQRGYVWKWQPLLIVGSLLIHPYLMVMVLAVLAAAPISLFVRRDISWKNAVLGFGFSVGVTALIMALLRYFSTKPPKGDFGQQQMNLLAPFHPALSSLIPGFHFDGAGTAWTGEGYQYLGVGIILVLFVSTVLLLIRPARLPFRRHFGLLVIAVALTLLALSTKVYVGDYLVVSIIRSAHILEQLRSSGRFFWPVTYLILIGAAVVTTRYLPILLWLPLLTVAAALQFADARGLRQGLYDAMENRPNWVIDVAQLRPLLASARQLTIWPLSECGADIDNPTFMQLLELASAFPTPVNTMYVARLESHPNCDPAPVTRPLQPGELRVFYPRTEDGVIDAIPDADKLCHRIGELTVCSLNAPSDTRANEPAH